MQIPLFVLIIFIMAVSVIGIWLLLLLFNVFMLIKYNFKEVSEK